MTSTLAAGETGCIMWPLLQAALPKCLVQKQFPHKLMFGTHRSQGIDIHSLVVTLTIQHAQAIIRHGHWSLSSRE